MTLEFVAEDSMNATSVYAPSIYYCGCAQISECDYSSISEDGATDGGNVLILRFSFLTCWHQVNSRLGWFKFQKS